MEMAGRAGGASYVIGRVMNNVTRSRYGKRLPQNRTTDFSQARSLVHAAGGWSRAAVFEISMAKQRY